MKLIPTDAQIIKLIEEEFPFPTFNSGQKETIQKAIKALVNGTKHVIIDAPTGSGKSAIALTIHAVMKRIHGEFRSCIITSTIGLQKQYKEDYPDLLDIKSKTHYPCPKKANGGYMSQDCMKHVFGKQCNKNSCPYIIARDAWIKSPDIKTTNSSFYVISPQAILPITDDEKLDLTIIDECHEIDKVLIENTSIKFKIGDNSYKRLKQHWKTFIPYYNEVVNILDKLPKTKHFTFKEFTEDQLLTLRDIHHESIRISLNFAKQAETMQNSESVGLKMASQEAMDLANNLDILLRPEFKSDYFKWIIAQDESELKIVPLTTRSFRTEEVLFSKAHQHLHMSATICGIKEYTENLYINEKDYVFIETHNPIPLKNRPVDINRLMQVNKDTDPKEITKLIDTIISEQSGNGVIHTVSFKLANDILKYSKYKTRMMVSNNREEILDRLECSNNTIVLSPSIETGYDFKGDLARWQIIAKLPFLNLGDLYTSSRLKISGQWYSRETVLRLIQASGRVCRGVNDYGKTYIIDKNVIRLIESNLHLFPEWFLDSVFGED